MSSGELNMFMEVVTRFISTLVDNNAPIVSVQIYQKPLINISVCDALKAHAAAYNSVLGSGNVKEWKMVSHALRRAMKETKWSYRDNVELQFQQHGTSSLWKALLLHKCWGPISLWQRI